jgi:hypothetical protein
MLKQNYGTTKGLWKNGASVTSTVSAIVSQVVATKPVGCMRNTAGTNSLFIACDFEYSIGGKYSTCDVALIYSELETLLDNW